jgi:hypothetical protein
MNIHSFLGGVAIGRDNSGNFRPSLKGVAVRIEKNRFVGVDNDRLLDVTPLTFEGADDTIYRVPIKDPQKGDLIIISDNPLRALFVREVFTNGHLRGLDPINSTVSDYVPTSNILNLKFYIKIVSLFDEMVSRTDQDKLLLLSLLGKGDGRTGVGESLLALLLLEFSGRQVPDQDLMRMLLLIRMAGTNSGGAAEALVLQRLMQSFARAGGSADAATGIAAPGHSVQTTERGPESGRPQS